MALAAQAAAQIREGGRVPPDQADLVAATRHCEPAEARGQQLAVRGRKRDREMITAPRQADAVVRAGKAGLTEINEERQAANGQEKE
jgi:hypothetical protein